MQSYALLALVCVALTALAGGWIDRHALATLWREPILKHPVLIVESDDWGAGPLEQAERLDRIATALGGYADGDGRKPVVTLGLVLGVADGARIAAAGLGRHYRISLADPELASVLAAIRRGADRGVFSVQLHGGEHYWPPALLAVARRDQRIVHWLNGTGIPRTEGLPPLLQTRWVDGSELPPKPLAAEEIKLGALAEAAEYRTLFGRDPTVAVPPTFVWNDIVESAWAEAGVQFVVTPGRRYTARTAHGRSGALGPVTFNGGRGASGVRYVVRDDYFEPARGHKAERALAALAAKTHLARPTLLETHRANFLGDAASAEAAVCELERLLEMALKRFPHVVFLSTEELGLRLTRNDPWLVERSLGVRLHFWLRRVWCIGRLRKLACVTGAIVPGWILYALTRAAVSRLSGG